MLPVPHGGEREFPGTRVSSVVWGCLEPPLSVRLHTLVLLCASLSHTVTTSPRLTSVHANCFVWLKSGLERDNQALEAHHQPDTRQRINERAIRRIGGRELRML